MDVIEIDGASNTGVDDVRELRENIKFAPFRGSYRVYIIDEVHMLSNSAFNALLKTLEEPPAHAIFVFATTEIHKIPATILSRCQHFNFRRIPRLEIMNRLRHVAEENQVTVDDRGLAAIARASDGSMRDGLSLLDQAVAFGGQTIRYEDLESMLGAVPEELVRGLIESIIRQDSPQAVDLVAQVLDRGYDLRAYCSAVVERIRNLLVAAVVPSKEEVQRLMDLSVEEVDHTVTEAKSISVPHLQDLFGIFSRVEDMLRGTVHPRFAFEVAVIKATRILSQQSVAVEAPQQIPVKKDFSTPSRSQAPSPPRPPVTGQRPVESKPSTSENRIRPTVPPSRSGPTDEKRNFPSRPQPKAEPVRPQVAPGSGPSKPADLAIAPASAVPALKMEQWEGAVDRLIQDHPNIGTFLEMGTLMKLDPDQVVIGYPRTASVACSRIQKDENRGLVARKIQEIAGRTYQVRIVELKEGETAGPTIGQLRAKRQEEDTNVLLEEAKAHPFVKQAMEIFGSDIVEARRISDKKEA